MSKEMKRYYVQLWRMEEAKFAPGPLGACEMVKASDYDALLAERDRMAKALKEIDDAYCNSSPTATDFGISWDRGMLIGTMKDIARAALQGEQS